MSLFQVKDCSFVIFFLFLLTSNVIVTSYIGTSAKRKIDEKPALTGQ